MNIHDILAHPAQYSLVLTILVTIVGLPLVMFIAVKRTSRRSKISERGIRSLDGKCPKCGGNLKAANIFTTRDAALTRYKIGAARCTRCNHLEIFSEEP